MTLGATSGKAKYNADITEVPSHTPSVKYMAQVVHLLS